MLACVLFACFSIVNCGYPHFFDNDDLEALGAFKITGNPLPLAIPRKYNHTTETSRIQNVREYTGILDTQGLYQNAYLQYNKPIEYLPEYTRRFDDLENFEERVKRIDKWEEFEDERAKEDELLEDGEIMPNWEENAMKWHNWLEKGEKDYEIKKNWLEKGEKDYEIKKAKEKKHQHRNPDIMKRHENLENYFKKAEGNPSLGMESYWGGKENTPEAATFAPVKTGVLPKKLTATQALQMTKAKLRAFQNTRRRNIRAVQDKLLHNLEIGMQKSDAEMADLKNMDIRSLIEKDTKQMYDEMADEPTERPPDSLIQVIKANMYKGPDLLQNEMKKMLPEDERTPEPDQDMILPNKRKSYQPSESDYAMPTDNMNSRVPRPRGKRMNKGMNGEQPGNDADYGGSPGMDERPPMGDPIQYPDMGGAQMRKSPQYGPPPGMNMNGGPPQGMGGPSMGMGQGGPLTGMGQGGPPMGMGQGGPPMGMGGPPMGMGGPPMEGNPDYGQEMGQGGPPMGMGQGGSPMRMGQSMGGDPDYGQEMGGPPMGMGQGGQPMGMGQGGPSMGMGQQGPPMGMGQGGMGQGGPPMRMGQGGPSMGMGQGGPPMGMGSSMGGDPEYGEEMGPSMGGTPDYGEGPFGPPMGREGPPPGMGGPPGNNPNYGSPQGMRGSPMRNNPYYRSHQGMRGSPMENNPNYGSPQGMRGPPMGNNPYYGSPLRMRGSPMRNNPNYGSPQGMVDRGSGPVQQQLPQQNIIVGPYQKPDLTQDDKFTAQMEKIKKEMKALENEEDAKEDKPLVIPAEMKQNFNRYRNVPKGAIPPPPMGPPGSLRSRSKTRSKPPKIVKPMNSSMPFVDDFQSPIKWVMMNSNETQDGLARVTDPATGKNMVFIKKGTAYVPVADLNLVRLGLTVKTTTMRVPKKIDSVLDNNVLRTVSRSVDIDNIEERDWLVIETSMGGRNDPDKCEGETCQARCHKIGCETLCQGDTCAAGCVGASCTSFCKGPGCLSMCVGEKCSAKCDGQACDSRCRGEGCESKCTSFSCMKTKNGVFTQGGGTWEENYPEVNNAPNIEI